METVPNFRGENMETDGPEKKDSSLDDRLALTDHLKGEILALATAMIEADDHKLYGMDLFAIGAANRAVAHCAGFKRMIKDRNLICAGSLLRLQIDTAIRFHASFLVKNPHEFSVEVLGGAAIREMKDQSGHKMTDRYLVGKLSSGAEWLPRVYHETSGYIHLSGKHLMSAFTPAGDHQIDMKIDEIDKPLPDSIYIEAIEGFCAATSLFMKYLYGWVLTKSDPDLVRKQRNEGQA